MYAGYAGWAPGQLDAELERGDWHAAPPDEESIFTSRPTETWHRLVPPIPTERARAGRSELEHLPLWSDRYGREQQPTR